MSRMRCTLILTLMAAALALPAAAAAVTLAPPGKAGADQYFETLPASGGNVAPPAGKSNGGTGSPTLSHLGQGAAGASRLARLGRDGAAAAALASSTAPTPAAGAGTSGARAGHHRGLPRLGVAAAQASSTTGALSHVLTGSDAGGLGLILPLLLATAAIAALGFAGAKLRGRGNPPNLSA